MNNAVSRNPVLLIHGIDDTGAVFERMVSYLKQDSYAVYHLDLMPNCGAIGLDVLASQVAAYIDRTFPTNQPLDLVGFSMGGIVGRYYVQRLGGIDRVQRFITISSPHLGTWAAYARLNPGCNQMRPNSPFLLNLNQDAVMLNRINFTSIWTPLDLIIVPANSSHLSVGKSIPVWVGGHAWMMTDPRSIQTVRQSLAEPLRSQESGMKVSHRSRVSRSPF
jgi:triacylglycerol lipase